MTTALQVAKATRTHVIAQQKVIGSSEQHSLANLAVDLCKRNAIQTKQI